MRKNSEIFENFLKIAEEQGMVSDFSSEKAKQKLEKDPRADSLSVKDIEKLYNIKTETTKDNSYKKNIMEDAHPTSVIISPSYDKLNGLVENNIERQNIILNILNKTPNGQSTQHRYASQDLILSLVRIANDLDNQNNEKLRALADVCLFQLSGPIKKEAAVTLLGALGVTIPVLLGTLYLQQHLSFINEGFEKNHQKLIEEVDDLLESSSSWGVGYSYKANFIAQVQDLKNKLNSFYGIFRKVEPVITELETPRTSEQLIQLAKQPTSDSVVSAYNTFKSAAENMLPYINTIEKNFSSETFKVKQIEDKGFLSSLVDKTQILHGGKGLIADDFDDVVRALSPYKKSISDLLSVLKNAESIEKSAQQQLQTAVAETPPATPQSKKLPATDMEAQIGDLEKDLAGGLE